ncbi:MAG: peptidylprolyl isomerase [Defluviitaleaceae bacterium]|nr:peptidylprolyl isomerase [Defluviitaleaceae bacterium]
MKQAIKSSMGSYMLLALVIIMAFALTGCVDNTGEAEVPAYYNDAAGEEGNYVVARVNGVDITTWDVKFEMQRAANTLMWEYVMMFPDDEDFDHDREFRDGQTFGRVLREQAAQFAAELKLYMDFANQLGITISIEEASGIANHIEALREHHGEEELEALLWGDGIRGTAHLEAIFEAQVLLDSLFHVLLTDPVEFARFEAYMPEEIICDAHERAIAIVARIQEGEDFAALVVEYGEDPGMTTFPDGYTFVDGDMVPEFQDAVKTLEIGEVSEPVRSQFGYHIIMRVEPDPDNVMPNSRFFAGDGEDELLGAKHILFMLAEGSSTEDRMVEAIFTGFEAMFENANIEFLPALDDVPVPEGVAVG